MEPFLSSPAWNELMSDYSIGWEHDERLAQPLKSIAVSELLQREQCDAYLSWFAQYIGAASINIAASMLIKRYAFLLAAPALYAMTYYDKGIVPSLTGCQLVTIAEAENRSRSRFPDLRLASVELTAPAASGGSREQWREQYVGQLFAEHIAPLLQSVAAAGSVSAAILWENVMVRIAPLYAEDDQDPPQLRQRKKGDFSFLAVHAPAQLFAMRKNPLTRFVQQTEADAVVPRSQRLTCCLYYLMAPEYCKKCPKSGSQKARL